MTKPEKGLNIVTTNLQIMLVVLILAVLSFAVGVVLIMVLWPWRRRIDYKKDITGILQ